MIRPPFENRCSQLRDIVGIVGAVGVHEHTHLAFEMLDGIAYSAALTSTGVADNTCARCGCLLGSAVGRRAIGHEYSTHVQQSPFHNFSDRRRFVLGRDENRKPLGDGLPLLGRNELVDAIAFEVFDFVALFGRRRVHDEICDAHRIFIDDRVRARRGLTQRDLIRPSARSLILVVDRPHIVVDRLHSAFGHRQGRTELNPIERHVAPVISVLPIGAKEDAYVLDLPVVEDVSADTRVLLGYRALDRLMVKDGLVGKSVASERHESGAENNSYCHWIVLSSLASPMRVTTA